MYKIKLWNCIECLLKSPCVSWHHEVSAGNIVVPNYTYLGCLSFMHISLAYNLGCSQEVWVVQFKLFNITFIRPDFLQKFIFFFPEGLSWHRDVCGNVKYAHEKTFSLRIITRPSQRLEPVLKCCVFLSFSNISFPRPCDKIVVTVTLLAHMYPWFSWILIHHFEKSTRLWRAFKTKIITFGGQKVSQSSGIKDYFISKKFRVDI